MRFLVNKSRHKLGKMFEQLWEYHLAFLVSLLVLLLIGAAYCDGIYPKIEFEISGINSGDTAYLYYNNGNNGFDDQHLIRKRHVNDDNEKYNFHMPTMDMFRIAFITGEENFEIRNMKIKTIFTDKEISAQFMKDCLFSESVERVHDLNDVLLVEQRGTSWFLDLYDLESIDHTVSLKRVVLFILYVFLLLAIPVTVSLNNNKLSLLFEKVSFKKWHAVILSALLYFSVRISFFKLFAGYFAFDEFYHIATVNPNYTTDYDRALYINDLVRGFCKILGKSDLAVKFVPFILGSISFLCALYLLYHLYIQPFWILTVSIIYTFMPYLQYNHFYIRMYIFLETTVMIICVLVYYVERKKDNKWGKISMLLADLAALSYCMNVKDLSSKALLVLMIAVNVYFFLGKKIKALIGKNLCLKIVAAVLFAGGIVATAYFIAVKQHWISSSLLKKISVFAGMDLETFYHADSPVFIEFLFAKMHYVVIPFVISMLCILRKKQSKNKMLFMMAGLPMLGYFLLFYDSYLIRSYIAYFPVICILAFLAFDRFKISGCCQIAVILSVTVLTINIQSDFWVYPSIPGETGFINLGGAIEYARDLEKRGYEIVPMMAFETQSAYFELLDAKINLNTADILIDGKTDEKFIKNTLKQLLQSDEQRAVVAEAKGVYLFQEIIEGTQNEKYDFRIRKFAGNAAVIVIN